MHIMTETVSVTPSMLETILNNILDTKVTPFIWGGPGIGKSSIVKQIAEKHNLEFIDIRLSIMDPVTLNGVMIPDISNGTARTLPPDIFFNRDKPALIFFDELNSAAPSIQAAAYQIILDRRVGPHALKKNDVIIAAGNDYNDRGVVFKMPAPLANRFIHFNLRVNFNDFMTYAVKNKFHKDVIGYLNYQRGDLYSPNNNAAEMKGFPTPRSWEFVSKILHKVDENNFSTELLLPILAGAVGEGVAYKFASYRRITESLVNIDDILTGKIKEMKPKNIDSAYAIITALCYSMAEHYEAHKKRKLSKKQYDEYCDNFMGYLLNNDIQPEMVIMAVRMLMTMFDLEVDIDLPNWDRFFNDNVYSTSIREVFTGLEKKVI